MKQRAILCAIALLLCGASAPDRDETLASSLIAELESGDLTSFTTVSELPAGAARALDVHGTFWMADPGDKWNPSCNRDSDNPEADRRLIIGAKSAGFAAVHYEAGGISRHSSLELFELAPDGHVVLRCSYSSSYVATTLSDLRSAFPGAFNFLHCRHEGDQDL